MWSERIEDCHKMTWEKKSEVMREEGRGGEVREEDEVQYIIEIVVITTNV